MNKAEKVSSFIELLLLWDERIISIQYKASSKVIRFLGWEISLVQVIREGFSRTEFLRLFLDDRMELTGKT